MRARTTGWDGMVVTVVAVGKRGAVRRKAEHTSEPEHWFTITADYAQSHRLNALLWSTTKDWSAVIANARIVRAVSPDELDLLGVLGIIRPKKT